MKLIRELGQQIVRSWSQLDYDEAKLPEVACRALEDAKISSKVDVIDWLLEVQDPGVLPNQRYAIGAKPFGDAPLTLFNSERLFIEVLYWCEGTTDTHQHGFSGAFCVMAGSSLMSEFSFETTHRISSFMKWGHLKATRRELLKVGDVRRIHSGSNFIHSGSNFIHSVFHLEMPSVTLVVRTPRDADGQPQFSYRDPHLAVDPTHHDETMNRQVMAMDVLARVQPQRYWMMLAELLAASDFEKAVTLLLRAFEWAQSNERMIAPLIEHMAIRHGEKARYLMPVWKENRRRKKLLELRAHTTDPELRFFLALLLNNVSKTEALNLASVRISSQSGAEEYLVRSAKTMKEKWPAAMPTDASVLEFS